MSEDLTKKAAEILLKGGTLLSEHCPYCKGVRVMKDGQALCASCGREPKKKDIPRAWKVPHFTARLGAPDRRSRHPSRDWSSLYPDHDSLNSIGLRAQNRDL